MPEDLFQMTAWGVPGMKLFHLYLISLTISSSKADSLILRGGLDSELVVTISGVVDFSIDLCLPASKGMKFEWKKY